MGIQGNENSFFTRDIRVGPDGSISYYSQCVIMIFAGGGVIANDVLKMRKVIEFQSSQLLESTNSTTKFIFV